MSAPFSATGAILAGGKSRRMGVDKCCIRTPGGEPIVEVVAAKFGRLFEETIVIGNNREVLTPLGLPIFTDEVPNAGSLGGIYTAILHATHDRCFVAACDMPFLSEDLVRHMLARPVDYDVLIPHPEEGYEPLHAIYRKTCLTPIKRLLDRGRRKIIEFFPEVTVAEIGPDKLIRLDPNGLSFFNINTPEDLAHATYIWKKELG